MKLACVAVQASEPALTDATIQSDIRAAARAAGYTALDLPSGAGHDAQDIAHLAPIGMIFVPSRDGISHPPVSTRHPTTSPMAPKCSTGPSCCQMRG